VLSTPAADGRWAYARGLDGSWAVSACAIAAMTVGNLGALRERSLRRLLVAGAIAHVGYALVGVAAASDDGLRAIVFSTAAFSIGMIGALHVATLIARARGTDDLGAVTGLLGGRAAPLGIALGIFLLSLVGVPPLVGFRAKLHLFAAALDEGHPGLVAVGFVSSAASLFAYARVLAAMRTAAPAAPPVRVTLYDAGFAASLLAATVAFGVYEMPLLDLAARSAHLLPR